MHSKTFEQYVPHNFEHKDEQAQARDTAYNIKGDMGLAEEEYIDLEIAFLVGKYVALKEYKEG
jgi:hypothetical protein